VTLELTAVGAGDAAIGILSNPGINDDTECSSRYGPLVTVMARENHLAPIGEAHANYDMKARMDYGKHANTDLNGAFSFGGGPWKASVSGNHMGNKETVVSGKYGPFEAYVAKTSFSYRKEKLEFTDDRGDGHVCRIDYRVIPEGWTGGGWQNGDDVRYKDSSGQMDAARGKGWALPFGKNTAWTKNTGKGYKFHGSISAFGASLYAQSTWSNQVDLFYSFGKETTQHWLYGSNGQISDAENVYAW
jgi:hypothetical protein